MTNSASLENRLAPFWRAEPGQLLLLSQASHALTVIDETLVQSGRPDPQYWFPAYFCDAALPALRRRGRTIRFYPVHADFTPDWEACEQMAGEGAPALFTLAHYFGLQNDIAGALKFCSRHGALLHEDCAHAMLPYGDVGRQGDFVSYSPRKFFPVGDGGILVSRHGATHRAAARLPPRRNLPAEWMWLRWRNRLLGREGRKRPLGPVTLDIDVPQPPPFASIWMSSGTRRVLASAADRGEFHARVAATPAKVARLAEAWGGPDLEHLAPLPGALPRWIVFRAGDEPTTLREINRIRAGGIRAFTWPGLPPEVLAAPERYGAAWRLRRTLVRVPID